MVGRADSRAPAGVDSRAPDGPRPLRENPVDPVVAVVKDVLYIVLEFREGECEVSDKRGNSSGGSPVVKV